MINFLRKPTLHHNRYIFYLIFNRSSCSGPTWTMWEFPEARHSPRRETESDINPSNRPGSQLGEEDQDRHTSVRVK